MRILIERESRPNEKPITGEVISLNDVPVLVFQLSQHYGSDTYTVIDADENLKAFRMTTEWLEDDA